MKATLITEVVATQSHKFAFKADGRALGVGRRQADGSLFLRLQDRSEHHCEDFDDARDLVRGLVPGGCACFERRRIVARHRPH